MPSQLVRQHDRAADVGGLFKINKTFMLRGVPRTTGDPDRLLSIAYNAIVYDQGLMECTPASLMGGVFEALKLGIALGGPMQEGWLIPFKNKSGGKDATLIVGYQGYRNIIDRAGSVIDLHPRAVYEQDEFDFEFGVHPRIRHRPYWMVGADKPGKLIAVYAIARLRRGGVQMEVLPVSEVEEHRRRSRAGQAGPWQSDYDAMALKTAIRKISKYLPKSNELLSRALDLDDKADRGVDQGFDVEGLVIPETRTLAEGGGRLSALTQALGGGTPAVEQAAAVGEMETAQELDDRLAAEIEAKLARERGEA